jgi:hypothetical protein
MARILPNPLKQHLPKIADSIPAAVAIFYAYQEMKR